MSITYVDQTPALVPSFDGAPILSLVGFDQVRNPNRMYHRNMELTVGLGTYWLPDYITSCNHLTFVCRFSPYLICYVLSSLA